METELLYESLRKDLEHAVGYEVKTPKDFDQLVDEIECRTHVRPKGRCRLRHHRARVIVPGKE